MDDVATGFEVVGVVIIVIRGVVALIGGFKAFRDLDKYFLDVRRSFGRPLILGPEILVAADIIKTITVDPSLESVTALGILVLVRTALSFSLDLEVEGMAPWRRYEMRSEVRASGLDPDRDWGRMRDREWLRWLRRRLREAARDDQWLLPTLGAVGGLLLALAVATGGATETYAWTVSVDRSRDTLLASLTLVSTALSIALALASVSAQNVVGRLGSRTLRIYLRRSGDRWVVGIFAFAAIFIIAEHFQLRP